ncbi:glycerol-3-phosphate dehydrogenase/oxidase [Acerihabitans sp. TG2]|uniref:glycerol-3-phosphate dehydrogenase/oxidase n=1 Tax=Acerihabitans sp. TG2 TaxID=3096008 RepID=UPI002B224091|nr:glycerol-3-phosphate dehydrogenase/oxidase [Acerihabitans sp. TG2]MEA9390152.1 glycerol-3-phosphate dehydrogenase/oxidase [Acerihabitans sp. TG2]
MFSNEKNSQPPQTRQSAWEALKANPTPEVLIIGGGVNGVGLLRDLSLNGVSATLIDSGDFCSGASSASSRMAHGGLRYLEGREFDLVRESARERNMLLHDAGHLVKPLEVVVPVLHWVKGLPQTALRFFGLSRTPGPLSFIALKSGLLVYERFGAIRRTLPHHRVVMRRSGFPSGTPQPICAVISYYDGQITGPEALIFEMLGAAIDCDGVTAVNHLEWSYRAPGQFVITDPVSNETVTLKPRMVVNATGAAIDRVNDRLGLSSQLVRGVKGAHLVLHHPTLHQRMCGRAFYFDDGHGRMVICLPVQDVILVGTTEVETHDPQDHSVMASEIDYLLTSLNSLFDDVRVTAEHIVAVTSGIRPLQASSGSATQAARDHALIQDRVDHLPLISLVGGKWTTFRAFTALAADVVLNHVGKARTASTLDRPYPGAGAIDVAQLTQRSGLSTAHIEQLYARYGTLAEPIALFCAQGDDAPVDDAPGYSQREIIWLTRYRMALSLEDMILRRTNIVMTGRLSITALEHISAIMADTLGHDKAWAKAQFQGCAGDPRILWNGK